MTTTSSVGSTTSTAPTISTGNAQNVAGLTAGSVTLSLAEEIAPKVQPYLDHASAIQTQINTNQTQIAAYQNMQSLLQTLQTTASNLTSESLTGSNAFNSRVANLTSNSSTPASSILSATVTSGTATGTHSLTVTQLAAAESDTSATLSLASGAAISTLGGWPGDGTITVAEGSVGSAVAVNINSTMTLTDVANAINNVSATNKVTASVVNVSSTQQVLVLSGADANQALSLTDSNGILSSALGVTSTANSLTGSANPTVQAGSFTVTSGGQSAGPITVTAGEAVATIVSDINTAAAAAGSTISASVVGTSVQITGVAGNFVGFSGVTGSALTSLGIPAIAANGAANQVTAAQGSIMTVDGVSGITRNSNTVTDVLSGVTLNLTQASPSTQVTVQIAPDTTGATTAITNFVTAYNSWESFVTQNEATASGGGAAPGATLFGDATLRQASTQIDSTITQEINATSLGALGISINSANQLVINSVTLSSALSTNFATVSNFFQSTITSGNYDLQPSSNNFSNYAGSFTLNISTDASNNINGLTITNSSGVTSSAAADFTYAGGAISGISGSPFDGMYFTYNSTGGPKTANIAVTATQGMANQLYSATNIYDNALTGSVESLILNKESSINSLTTNYNTLINEANNYANFLTQQYSSLTQKIQTNGQTLNTLKALFNAQYSNNG